MHDSGSVQQWKDSIREKNCLDHLDIALPL